MTVWYAQEPGARCSVPGETVSRISTERKADSVTEQPRNLAHSLHVTSLGRLVRLVSPRTLYNAGSEGVYVGGALLA